MFYFSKFISLGLFVVSSFAIADIDSGNNNGGVITGWHFGRDEMLEKMRKDKEKNNKEKEESSEESAKIPSSKTGNKEKQVNKDKQKMAELIKMAKSDKSGSINEQMGMGGMSLCSSDNEESSNMLMSFAKDMAVKYNYTLPSECEQGFQPCCVALMQKFFKTAQ